MANKNIARNGINYNSLMKRIRPFVDFDYDLRGELSQYERSKIKKYAVLIDELTAHPYQIYKPRNKANLKKVKQFAVNPIKGYKGMKVAIVPNAGKKAKIRIKNNEVYTSTEHVDERTILFDPIKLALDPRAHTEEVIKQNKGAKRFTLKCGVHEQRRPFSRELIAKEVAEKSEKYNGQDGMSDYRDWLVGLSAYSFKNQDDFNDQMLEKENAAKKSQRERRNAVQRLRASDKRESQQYGLYSNETGRMTRRFDEWSEAFDAQQAWNKKAGSFKYIAKKA